MLKKLLLVLLLTISFVYADKDAGSESDFGSIATETTLEETSAAPTDVEVGEDELLINSLSDQE